MTRITSRDKWLSAVGAVAIAGLFLGSPARADGTAEVYIDNTDNRTVTVTANDMNDGGKSLTNGPKTLKHNERWSGTMKLDKNNDGHVKFEAKAVDAKGCETRTYEPKQMGRGFAWSVSLKCS